MLQNGSVCHSRFPKSTHLNLGIISLIYLYFSKLKIIYYIAYLKWISTPYESIFSFLFFSSHTCTLLITKYVPTFFCLLFIWHTHCTLYFQVMFAFLLLLLFFLFDRKPINHRILVSQQYNLLIVAFEMWYFWMYQVEVKTIYWLDMHLYRIL